MKKTAALIMTLVLSMSLFACGSAKDEGSSLKTVTGGTLKTEDDYRKILDYTYNQLGEFKTKNLHIHFSKIEYTDKGEVKHLTLDDTKYGPEFEPLAKVIKEMQLEPSIISESHEVMMQDAMKLQEIYEKIGEN